MGNGRSGDFMAGFLLGGVIGAAVALLLAPQSGEQTRELLKEKSGELKEKARERMADLSGKAKEQAGEMLAAGKEALKERKEKLMTSLHGCRGEEETGG